MLNKNIIFNSVIPAIFLHYETIWSSYSAAVTLNSDHLSPGVKCCTDNEVAADFTRCINTSLTIK